MEDEVRIIQAQMHILEAGIQSMADTAKRKRPDDLKDLEHLDIKTPCSAGSEADIIDEDVQCQELGQWSVRVHDCAEIPDGYAAAVFCSHHLAALLMTMEILRVQSRGQMPCGYFAPSVYDLVRFELC